MQVMPRVARQLGFKGSVMDPASNILLAAKVLGKIEKSLDFGPSASEMDRLRIVLACYNGGIGHVIDAAESRPGSTGATPTRGPTSRIT